MRHIVRALVVAISFALPTLALPLTATPAIAQAQVELTDQTVVNFIASYPEVMGVADELEKQNNSSLETGDDPAAALGAALMFEGAMGKLDGAVSAHGFANYMEWIQVLSAVATAYAYYRDGGVDSQLQQAMDEINANPSLNADQKKMMVEQIKAASASMAATRPSQATIDAINAHADELTAIFDR